MRVMFHDDVVWVEDARRSSGSTAETLTPGALTLTWVTKSLLFS